MTGKYVKPKILHNILNISHNNYSFVTHWIAQVPVLPSQSKRQEVDIPEQQPPL